MTSAKDLEGRRVLIVEDRYLIASELAEQVRLLGGEVIGPAPSLEAATRLMRDDPPDLALLDVNLDGELIFSIAEQLEQDQTPIILLTGYDEENLPEYWRSRPRLLKPVNSQALRAELLRLA